MRPGDILKPLAWLHKQTKSTHYVHVAADKVISRFSRSRVLGWVSQKTLSVVGPPHGPGLVRKDLRKGEFRRALMGLPALSVEASKVAAGTDYAFLVTRPMAAPESLDPEDLYRAAKFLRDTGRVWPHATHITLRAPRPGNKWDPFVLCLREARSGMLLAGASILPPWARKPED